MLASDAKYRYSRPPASETRMSDFFLSTMVRATAASHRYLLKLNMTIVPTFAAGMSE